MCQNVDSTAFIHIIIPELYVLFYNVCNFEISGKLFSG